MDVTYPLLVVGMAERQIQLYNLNNPTTVFRVSATRPGCNRDVQLTLVIVLGCRLASKMADTRSGMQPGWYWIWDGQHRRPRGDPVSTTIHPH
jgi:hypothetical protein